MSCPLIIINRGNCPLTRHFPHAWSWVCLEVCLKFGGDLSIKIIHFWLLFCIRMDKKLPPLWEMSPHQGLC